VVFILISVAVLKCLFLFVEMETLQNLHSMILLSLSFHCFFILIIRGFTTLISNVVVLFSVFLSPVGGEVDSQFYQRRVMAVVQKMGAFVSLPSS